MIADLRRARRASTGFPEVLLVTLGDAAETASFLATRWPQARAIADPDRQLRTAFGIRRGGAREFLAPGVWLAGLRAALKGSGLGKPAGDVRSMPGMALVADGRLLWEQVFQHAGSKPDFEAVRHLARAWRAGPRPPAQPPETSTSASAPGGVSSSRSSR